MQNILLYAHRGSTILAPESTLPAFEVAILHGADILEIDVRMSHDVTTAATQAEVANLYFKRGLYKNPPFEYLQIPMHYMGLPLAGNTFISHAKKRGIKPVYWTINDQASMEKLISRGAAGFVTDRVDIAGKLLGKSRHK